MQYTTNGKIRQHLKENYMEELSYAKVDNLLQWWKTVSTRVEQEDDIDEYLKDITVRIAIEQISDLIEPDEKGSFLGELKLIDDVFTSKTIAIENPFLVQGKENKKNSWFYNRAPKFLVECEDVKVSDK